MKAEKIFRKFLLLFFFLATFALSSCSNRITYLEKGTFIKPNIWEKVEIDTSKITPDQEKTFAENGVPTYILTFFEANSEGKKGRPVDEWVYENQEKFFWFVNGSLTDYIPVKPPKEKRIKIPGM